MVELVVSMQNDHAMTLFVKWTFWTAQVHTRELSRMHTFATPNILCLSSYIFLDYNVLIVKAA